MRQAKKEIKDMAVLTGLLNTSHVGRLGTIGADGCPMIKPLNFAFTGQRLYFHTAMAGEKMEDIKRDPRVCFETDLPIALVKSRSEPCKAKYLFRSLIIKGKARIVEDRNEKLTALRLLMEKYQPEGGYGNFLEEKLRITGVVCIEIEEMTGKEDLGNGAVRERILKILEEKKKLPVVMEPE